MLPTFSVIVCVKNEELRIRECLENILTTNPDEVIVVDGNSNDKTVEIAKEYTNKIIVSSSNSLTKDRQIGIDAAKNYYIAMIDADHRITPKDIPKMIEEMEEYKFDIIQSQLLSYKNNNYWNAAEEQYWMLVHNIPGSRSMLGTAPAIYKKHVFEKVRFDGHITEKMDDTDFIYRLKKNTDFVVGVGKTPVKQLHFGNFKSYFQKFLWYGRGDGEFVRKHPNRSFHMLYHLTVRYPLVYSFQAFINFKFKVIPYYIFQGITRLLGAVKYLFLFKKV
ncbi:glycosyltransferase [Bacteriovoracales bacterium]|nr:glycosyltransferase [Bacteriovoracales bacterium]